MHFFVPRRLALFVALIFGATAYAQPVFTEFMFQPAGTPEPAGDEWIEIHNPNNLSIDLVGWGLTAGVSFTFPSGSIVPAGGYLIVAAHPDAFRATYPNVSATVVGGWSGQLANAGEKIELSNSVGDVVEEISYADEGDWAIRARGPLSFNHRGWVWDCEAAGTGRSFELRNLAMPRDRGQNWAASTILGGTPGAANSVAISNLPPIVTNVQHDPPIPRPTDPIVVSCRVEDEGPNATATLNWRIGTGFWQVVGMTDSDGDGDVEATISPRTHLSIIEFYISAADGTSARTWPAPARTSLPGVVPEERTQTVNALIQVDNGYIPATNFTTAGVQPIYRFVMTAAERQELNQIQTTNGQQFSEAEMNGTFISHDGTGLKVRYLCGFGNRGFGSALGPPNNFKASFPKDNRWNGRRGIQLNCRFPHSQTLGAALFAQAGIAPQEAAIVRLRVNGTDLATIGVPMLGRYARVEPLDGDWPDRHFPGDAGGSLYRADDHDPGDAGIPPGNLGSGEFRYEGENPAAYADTFIRQTNQDDTDWSDLIELCRVMSAPATGGTLSQPAISDAAYPAAVEAKLNIDQVFTYLATDALIGNQEGGLQTGRADDFSLYRGVNDPRFVFAPHDLDDVFDIGAEVGDPYIRSIFSYEGVQGMNRLFNHPQIVPRYYAKVLEQMDAWFNSATIDPLIDQIMGGWVQATGGLSTPASSIATIKNYVTLRRANVLSQIPQTYSLSVQTPDPDVDGYKRTTNGSATIAGSFNVAKTYSVTVNGTLARWFYRSVSGNVAGTWRLVVPAGGTFFRPGLNKVTATFWDQPNGTGKVLQEFSTNVFYDVPGRVVTGPLQPSGSIEMLAPAGYVPGVPMVVRLDLKDSQGNLDRQAWTRTATLSASNGVTISPSTVTLYNGMGSALVSVGNPGVTQTVLVARGGTSAAPNAAAATWKFLDDGAAPEAAWKSDPSFIDTGWGTGTPEFGANDGDERTLLLNAASGRRTWYFRHKFTVADPGAINDLLLRLVYDDGIAVYLNGTQLQRLNLAEGAGDGDAALSSRTPPLEEAIESFVLPKDALIAGENLLAVEVHNHSTTTDVSFDLELIASEQAENPGDFTLTATSDSSVAAKAIASLAGQPRTLVSGPLPAGTTTWSGIVQVTGDVTVPAGAVVNLDPGTVVLIDGTITAGDTNGRKITVNGTLNANGTAASPIQITSTDPTARWGQILFSGAQPSTLNHALLSHAGHSPGVGHTSRGPMLRLTGSSLTIQDSVLADGPSKALYSTGTCDVVLRRSLITRMITGPELGDGASLLAEDSNIQLILPEYRESTSSQPDDEDCLYIHNGSGRPVLVRRCAFVRCGDDVFDCLGGPITVEDSVLREGWDKGMSLLNNDLTIRRTVIADCDKAIVGKSSSAGTRTINVDRCTISCEDHDTSLAPFGYPVAPSDPDPDTPSTAIYTQNKAGQSNESAILAFTVTNSILQAKEPVKVDAPYSAANTIVRYSCTNAVGAVGAPTWPGMGNIEADPRFTSQVFRDFRLQAGSPCINTGDPAQLDPNGTRIEMGSFPFGVDAPGVLTWSPAGGPYRIRGDVSVPTGLRLVIEGGTAVHFDENRKIVVNGTIQVNGTANARVVFSNHPGAALVDDPILPGLQAVPPKWGGLRIVNSMSADNVIAYADFINAQGTNGLSDNLGCIGVISSRCLIDHCTFSGTHLRMVYGSASTVAVQWCAFPDMFAPGENPVAMGLDNVAEQVKFVGAIPAGGHLRLYHNTFGGNKGHNDVVDADSGQWGVSPVLDCRYNTFNGGTGDEDLDLGGDAYVASNFFRRVTKDIYTSDQGYASAISSGDLGASTTIMVARNTFIDVDHAINLKTNAGTIFEHNTVADLPADYQYNVPPIMQAVKCAPINLFIPEDVAPTPGDGAYAGFNLFSNLPRVFSNADLPGSRMSKLEATENYLDQVGSLVVGNQHPGGFLSLGVGNVQPGDPQFVSRTLLDYSLQPTSPAKAKTSGGFDFGATINEWVYLTGQPDSITGAVNASLKVGGPGLVAFKWRLDSGAWSNPILIGAGGVFPRGPATVRTGTINLNSLSNGFHKVEVVGRDFAGNWQPESLPTVRSWTVNTSLVRILINEVSTNSSGAADTIELRNAGPAAVDLTGWTLTDDPAVPIKYVVPSGTMVTAGGYLVLPSTTTGINLDKDGDAVFLYQGGVLRDSVAFGPQPAEHTIGRIGSSGAWALCTPTFGAVNATVRVGDPSAVRITEWFAQGDVLYDDDWIELFNGSALPVDISGLQISDNRGGSPEVHTMAPLSFMAANSYLKLTADGDPEKGPTHLSFSLDGEQEAIVIRSASGAWIDSIAFYPQTTDFSMARAGTAYGFRELPTGGFEIAPSDPSYQNALAILRGLRITEMMYNAIGGSDFDWVELRNTGATSFNLAGVRFVEGIDFTFPSIVLGPGQEIMVVKHLGRFQARYGTGVLVAGVYSGNLDNAGEKLALQLPAPFDANVLNFDYSDGWYTSTDGSGYALVIFDALAKAGLWDERSSWRASAALGGAPGGAMVRTDTYSGWSASYGFGLVTDDIDKDGLGALVEYSLAMDPLSPNGIDGQAGAPVAVLGPNGRPALSLNFPVNGVAIGGYGLAEATYRVQATTDFVSWTTIATKTLGTNWSGTAGATEGSPNAGFVPVLVEDSSPLGVRRLLRLQVAWTP